MNEANEMRQTQIALGVECPEAVLFRNNVGTGWQGTVMHQDPHLLSLREPRIVHFGLHKNSHDLIGLTTVTITQDMVGKKVAIFTGLEAKTKTGRIKPDQQHFIDVIKEKGGISGVFRNDAEAISLIKRGI